MLHRARRPPGAGAGGRGSGAGNQGWGRGREPPPRARPGGPRGSLPGRAWRIGAAGHAAPPGYRGGGFILEGARVEREPGSPGWDPEPQSLKPGMGRSRRWRPAPAFPPLCQSSALLKVESQVPVHGQAPGRDPTGKKERELRPSSASLGTWEQRLLSTQGGGGDPGPACPPPPQEGCRTLQLWGFCWVCSPCSPAPQTGSSSTAQVRTELTLVFPTTRRERGPYC